MSTRHAAALNIDQYRPPERPVTSLTYLSGYHAFQICHFHIFLTAMKFVRPSVITNIFSYNSHPVH